MADEREIVNVERALTALREACALLDKRRHPGFAESCATPGCGCPVCAFVARPDVLRLLAGEPERDKLCAICGAVTGGGICQEHVESEPPSQTCRECGDSGMRLRCQARDTPHDPECYGPCPACQPAPTEAGAE